MGILDTLVASPLAKVLIGPILVGIAVYTYKRYKRAGDDVDEWYRDALGLVARLEQAAGQTTTYAPADYDKLREKIDPVAEDIQSHAYSAPDGVDDESRVNLVQLSAFASGLIQLTEQSEELDATEFFTRLQEHGREHWDGEYTMGEVEDLIEGWDADALAAQMDMDAADEIDDEAADEFLEYFDDESIETGHPQTIDEALGMPMDTFTEAVGDGGVEEIVQTTMRQYVRMVLLERTNEINQQLEERRASL
jgi:hypothetical protein